MDLIQQGGREFFRGCNDAAFGGGVDLGGTIRRSVIKKAGGSHGTLTFRRTSLLIIEISLPKFSPRSLD